MKPNRAGINAVPGSHRDPLSKASPGKRAAPDQRVDVTIRVRSRAGADWEKRLMEMSSKPLNERTYLTREELSQQRGADPADLAAVERFAHARHLTVVEASIPKRTVRISGTVADLENAFRVKLKTYTSRGATYRGRTGSVYIPAELAGIVCGVFGLDNRPAGRRGKPVVSSETARPAKQSLSAGHSVAELKKLYNFPSGYDGAGQCIAIIELNSTDAQGNIAGTGYAVSDVETYFKKVAKIKGPGPSIRAIGVAGGVNKRNSGQPGDSEATLDIEIVGAAAPGAHIAVYFAPNTDAGFAEAVNAAVHDNLRNPSVISVSWGMPEKDATDQYLTTMNEILQDAAALGITVCCESGDYGSSDQPAQSRDGQLHVEFPASSPFALACGGSRLVSSAGTIRSETVWNDGAAIGATGGGGSSKFPRPKYQKGSDIARSWQGITGRGVPDVAGHAVAYKAIVYGKEIHLDGTSAVAPLWAGLIAIINQALQADKLNAVGFLNPLIYGCEPVRGSFHDITVGNNDIDGKFRKYTAAAGWDPCTGMGSPDGTQLLNALQAIPKSSLTISKGHGKAKIKSQPA